MIHFRSDIPIAKLPEHLQDLARVVDHLPSVEVQGKSDGNGRISAGEAFKAKYYRNSFPQQLGKFDKQDIMQLKNISENYRNWSLPHMGVMALTAVGLVVISPIAIAANIFDW